MFEVPSTAGNINPLLNLGKSNVFNPETVQFLYLFTYSYLAEPPHYDGVQTLVVSPGAVGVDGELFSGSRDTCIKR